ncbi:MAG TPA: universal stress protein [Nitrolancea sp.]|nr:universal stress protein [Nitrolancea sp.]
MSLIGTILLPHDGSELANSTIPYAVALHQATGAPVRLLRVLEELRPIYDRGSRQLIWIDPEHPRAEAVHSELLDPVALQLAEKGVQSTQVIRVGDPRKEILAEAAMLDRPLILLASHGRSGLSRVVFGSVAAGLLRSSKAPVLIVRARHADDQRQQVRFANVVVPLDGSALSEAALPFAIELARETGARLQLVRVAETFRNELPADTSNLFMSPSYKAMLERFERLENETSAYLASVEQRLRSEGVNVSTVALSGDPYRELIDFVEREKPDLIVMTTHGRGGITRWFYGSVADRLLTTTTFPVLLVRSTE